MATATAPNPYLIAGRLKKAYEIARILYRADITPEQAKVMTPEEWARVASAAGVKPPSVETRELVYGMMARLAEPLDWGRISA